MMAWVKEHVITREQNPRTVVCQSGGTSSIAVAWDTTFPL